MAIEQLKVREIVKRAVSKDVDIPEFQREFVWGPEQVKLLAESLYRDYPIGSFLLRDSSGYGGMIHDESPLSSRIGPPRPPGSPDPDPRKTALSRT